jgi:type IV pilus assembly protein PilC
MSAATPTRRCSVSTETLNFRLLKTSNPTSLETESTMFSRQLPLEQLALACRSLSTMLEAGVSAFRAFELTAENSGDRRLRRAMQQVVEDLKAGRDVSGAVQNQPDAFPELFRNMVSVGDQTGKLPEVLTALADHYDNNLRLKRDFLSEISLPALQFVAAILIIGGLIWILGMIHEIKGGSRSGDQPQDILGWGLQGTPGAIKWFTIWGFAIVAGGVIYALLKRFAPGMRIVQGLLMHVPVVGRCLQSFAIARFSWAFHLTQNAGVPIDQSVDASLNATGNAYFQSRSQSMVADLMRGATITETFTNSGLFPRDYLQLVSVGETTGTVPEMLNRLSPKFEDQARRSLKLLATTAASLTWGMVAAFVIVLVFRIAGWYVGMIDAATASIEQGAL